MKLYYFFSYRSDVLQGEIDWNQPKASRDLQAEIDKAVKQGMFNVFMNTNVVFKDGNSKGNMMIQNIDTNIYPMYVEIYNDDIFLYKSDIIDPGYKIEEAKPLKAPLSSLFFYFFSTMDIFSKQ